MIIVSKMIYNRSKLKKNLDSKEDKLLLARNYRFRLSLTVVTSPVWINNGPRLQNLIKVKMGSLVLKEDGQVRLTHYQLHRRLLKIRKHKVSNFNL